MFSLLTNLLANFSVGISIAGGRMFSYVHELSEKLLFEYQHRRWANGATGILTLPGNTPM